MSSRHTGELNFDKWLFDVSVFSPLIYFDQSSFKCEDFNENLLRRFLIRFEPQIYKMFVNIYIVLSSR